MNEKRNITILNPTTESTIVKQQMAHRLVTLDDKILAVVNNGKRNSDLFLNYLIQCIKRRYSLKEVIWIEKKNASLPMPNETLEQLKTCQAVIAGVGD